MTQYLNIYKLKLSSLHCNKQKGLVAPHKALMLMAVMDGVEQGLIPSNHIVPNKELVDLFMLNWNQYVPQGSVFKPTWENPFWHLQFEGFWAVKCPSGEAVLSLIENSPSKAAIEDLGLYAVIDDHLWNLMGNIVCRDALREVLISSYLCQDMIDQAADGKALYGVKSCLFCKRTADLIMESELSKAFYDRFPVSKGHSLIVPKRHVADYHDLCHEEKVDLWDCEEVVKEILVREFGPDGFNVGVNIGRAAGQSIYHVHLHVIPRYMGDVENPKGGIRGVIPAKQNY